MIPNSAISVTVIMPVYNGAAFLREAIESVLAQTGVDYELLIGDNVSTDDSVAIAESFRDPRIRLIRRERNLGLFGNLNSLIAESRHELIQILCCDDALLPGALVAQRDFMLAHPAIAFARCRNTVERNWWTKPVGRYEALLPEVINPEASALMFVAFGCIVGSLSNAVVRKSMALNAGGFRTDLPMVGDFEFWVRLAQRAPLGINKRELVLVRLHEQQLSSVLKKNNDHLAQTDLVMKALFSRLMPEDQVLAKKQCSIVHATRQFRSALEVWKAGRYRDAFRVCKKREWAYPWPVIALYFIVGYKKRWGHETTSRRLLKRICELNSVLGGAVEE